MPERYPLNPSLNGPRNKLMRAREHLKELWKAFEWMQKEPDKRPHLDFESVEEGDWHVIQGKLRNPIPPDMSIIAGDALHNMRSALDHLACQLVILNKKKPSKQNSFPIYDHRPTEQRKRQQYKAKVKGMSAAHQDSLHRLQPFELKGKKEGHMLSRLGALDNLDKHQMIPPALASTGWSGEPSNYIRVDAPVIFELVGGDIDENGEVPIARFRRADGTKRPFHWELDIQMATRTAIGAPDMDLAMFDAIHALVSGIVESFGPEFP